MDAWIGADYKSKWCHHASFEVQEKKAAFEGVFEMEHHLHHPHYDAVNLEGYGLKSFLCKKYIHDHTPVKLSLFIFISITLGVLC